MKNFKTLFLASALVSGSLLSQGCDGHWSAITVPQTQFRSSLLTRLSRPDGSDIPDLVQAIQELFGFRAQVMNFAIPSVTIAVASYTASDPSEFDGQGLVTGWETFAPTVINDAQSLAFDVRVNGKSESCWDTGDSDGSNECFTYRRLFKDYVDFYARLIRDQLAGNLTLEFLGEDAQGNSKVLTLKATDIEYGCIGDETHALTESRVQCSGKANFSLGDPSARLAAPTAAQLERAAKAARRE